jgi:amidohydrolase
MPSPDKEKLKERAINAVEAQRDQLIDLSLRIHGNPEMGFQEEKASRWLCDYLEEHGFRIERAFCGLETAFKAVAGEGEPRTAFLAEYDALPGLGHACGHNIIAASSTGAAVALEGLISEVGGSVVVIGTPAEEIQGGKAIMAERGAFDGLDAVMLFHPGSRNAVFTGALACASLYVEYFGKEAHASTRPESGINALDAVIVAYNAISALRQHIPDTARIHGVIVDGGKAPNVIPGHSAASFLVRASDEDYLEELKEKVISCFRAGAEATGARLEYRWAEVQYAPLRLNRPLAEACKENLARLGRKVGDSATHRGLGSTDAGNVSLVAPTIHPSIAIASRGVAIHTPDFARVAASEEGHRGLLDAAKALAMTAVDVQTDGDLRHRIREYFLGQSPSAAL